MKLKSIYIDGLHNAVMKTYPLDDLVYFYGRNGAGKSTILQAIQLALLGYIPGGHKTKEAILKHSKDNRVVVRLELIDDNGQNVIIERKYDSKSSKKTILPTDYDIQSIISDIELPIFNFDEFVNQTANKIKEYFIQNILPTTDGELNWETILKDGLFDVNIDNKDEVIKYGLDLISSLEGNAIEQVTQANTIFKEEQSFNKGELNRLQATIDSLIYYDDYVGPKSLEDINAQLLALGALRDQVIKYDTFNNAVLTFTDEIHTLESYIESLGGDDGLEKLTSALEQANADYADISLQISNKNSEIMTYKAENAAASLSITCGGICAYTNTPCQSIQDRLGILKAEVESRNNKIAEVTKEFEDLNLKQNNIQFRITQIKHDMSSFTRSKTRLEAIKKMLGNSVEKPNTDKTLSDIDIEIEELNQSKSKLQANIQYNNTIENITNLKYKTELTLTALQAWIKYTDANGLQTSLTVKPFEELAAKMTTYIQTMYGDNSLKANFNISSKANSFSFGLVRDGKYIPYEQLSAGEKCLYTLALMICITHTNKSPLKLILVDNSLDNLDDIAVENTFKALKNIDDIQFIMAGVKACENAKDIIVTI